MVRSVKPMLFERFRWPDLYNQCSFNSFLDGYCKTNPFLRLLWKDTVKPMLFWNETHDKTIDFLKNVLKNLSQRVLGQTRP